MRMDDLSLNCATAKGRYTSQYPVSRTRRIHVETDYQTFDHDYCLLMAISTKTLRIEGGKQGLDITACCRVLNE
jgi:hypothetical protein